MSGPMGRGSSCGCTHAGCSHSGGRLPRGSYRGGRSSSYNYYHVNLNSSSRQQHYRYTVYEKNPMKTPTYIAHPENKMLKDAWKYMPFSIMALFMFFGILFLGVIPQFTAIVTGAQEFRFVFVRNVVIALLLGFGAFWFPFIILRDYIRQIRINKTIIERERRKKAYDKNSGTYINK